jgi:hypothetical protein
VAQGDTAAFNLGRTIAAGAAGLAQEYAWPLLWGWPR